VNGLRKSTGLAVTDRIRLSLPDAEIVETYRDRLAAETLAVSVEVGPLGLERASSAPGAL
jgi:hypothetical protein